MPLGTMPGVHPSTAAIASSPKLLDRVRWHLRVKHYSIRTEQAYVDWRVKASLTRHRRYDLLMHYVYVMRSLTDGAFYIGYSADLRKRFPQHTEGSALATARRRPWKLIYYEAYIEQADAIGRERYLKSGAGRRFLRAQLANYLKRNPLTPTA